MNWHFFRSFGYVLERILVKVGYVLERFLGKSGYILEICCIFAAKQYVICLKETSSR
jgi:hypothetical protein